MRGDVPGFLDFLRDMSYKKPPNLPGRWPDYAPFTRLHGVTIF